MTRTLSRRNGQLQGPQLAPSQRQQINHSFAARDRKPPTSQDPPATPRHVRPFRCCTAKPAPSPVTLFPTPATLPSAARRRQYKRLGEQSCRPSPRPPPQSRRLPLRDVLKRFTSSSNLRDYLGYDLLARPTNHHRYPSLPRIGYRYVGTGPFFRPAPSWTATCHGAL